MAQEQNCAKPTCNCKVTYDGGVMKSPYCSVECERGRPCNHDGCDCVDIHDTEHADKVN